MILPPRVAPQIASRVNRCSTAPPASSRRPTPPTTRCFRSGRMPGCSGVILVLRLRCLPADRQRVRLQGAARPGADLFAGRARPQHPHRLCRAALARHRRLHGGRRLCLLQADHRLPRTQPARRHPPVGLLFGGASASPSACRRCASRASTSRSRRSRRSSSSSGCSRNGHGSTTTIPPARSRCRPSRCSGFRSSARMRGPSSSITSCSASSR